MECIFVKKV